MFGQLVSLSVFFFSNVLKLHCPFVFSVVLRLHSASLLLAAHELWSNQSHVWDWYSLGAKQCFSTLCFWCSFNALWFFFPLLFPGSIKKLLLLLFFRKIESFLHYSFHFSNVNIIVNMEFIIWGFWVYFLYVGTKDCWVGDVLSVELVMLGAWVLVFLELQFSFAHPRMNIYYFFFTSTKQFY